MRKVRILHLRACNFVGGPERQILAYAEHDREGPAQPVLGTFVGGAEGTAFLAEAQRRGFETVTLPGAVSSVPFAAVQLARFVRQSGISLICTHGYKADICGTLAGKLSDVPVACFLRGWTRENRRVRFYEALNRRFLPLAARIVSLSAVQAERLAAAGIPPEKIRMVTNAVPVPHVSSEERAHIRAELRGILGFAPEQPVVGVAGRLSPEKGTAFFIEAAAQIRKKHPGAGFAVLGDGPLRKQLEERAAQLGLAPAIRFAGFVPEASRLFPGFDVIVNPSLSEEMPNVVLEGMAAGVPIVATDVGAVSEIAGEASFILVPAGNPAAIAEAVSALMQDAPRAAQMGQAARRRVAEAYSLECQRGQLHALYSELVPALSSLPARHERKETDGDFPRLSVVIPVRNEAKHLAAVLDDLLDQNYPPSRFEILVADGNSTDGTGEVVREYAQKSPVRIEWLQNPVQLSSGGRNVGSQRSAGEYVIFIDGHSRIPSSNLLRDTVRIFRETGADCLCRPQPLRMPDNTWLQRIIADVRASRIGHGADSTIYGHTGAGWADPTSSGASYRAAVFERIGFYDERFDACEDVEFNHRVKRAGLRSYWSPVLAVDYWPRNSISGLWKQMVRYGSGRLRLTRKHADALTMAQLVPALFLAFCAAGGIAALWYMPLRWLWLGVIGLYAAIVLASSAGLVLLHGWRALAVAPVVYLTVHFGLGAGFWRELWLTLTGRAPKFGRDAQPSSQQAVSGRGQAKKQAQDSAAEQVAAPKG